jgi:hypothetical protein
MTGVGRKNVGRKTVSLLGARAVILDHKGVPDSGAALASEGAQCVSHDIRGARAVHAHAISKILNGEW